MDSQIDKVLNQMFYKEFSHLDQCNDIYVDRKFSSKFEDSIKEIFAGLNETSGNNRRKQCKIFSIIVSLSILFFSLKINTCA